MTCHIRFLRSSNGKQLDPVVCVFQVQHFHGAVNGRQQQLAVLALLDSILLFIIVLLITYDSKLAVLNGIRQKSCNNFQSFSFRVGIKKHELITFKHHKKSAIPSGIDHISMIIARIRRQSWCCNVVAPRLFVLSDTECECLIDTCQKSAFWHDWHVTCCSDGGVVDVDFDECFGRLALQTINLFAFENDTRLSRVQIIPRRKCFQLNIAHDAFFLEIVDLNFQDTILQTPVAPDHDYH